MGLACAFRLSFCISRVSCANDRAEVSRAGSADNSESRDEEREESDDDRVEVVECSDRNVGYDVWQSVVSAFVSWADEDERVVGSDSSSDRGRSVSCER